MPPLWGWGSPDVVSYFLENLRAVCDDVGPVGEMRKWYIVN